MPSVASKRPIVNLDGFASRSVQDLVEIFNQITASASSPRSSGHLLVLQKSLSPVINFLSPFSKLKDLTDIRRVVWLDEDILKSNREPRDVIDYETLLKEFKSVVFLIEGSILSINCVAEILKTRIFPFTNSLDDGVSYYDLSVLVTSNSVKSADLSFTNLNVRGDIGLYKWSSSTPLMLSSDVLSLERESGGLRELYQLGSVGVISDLAQALLDLIRFSKYNIRITNEFAKGSYSKEFLSIFKNLRETHYSSLSPQEKKLLDDIDDALFVDQHSFFDRQCDLIVLERGLDFVTPLLTQLTYTGLCDEVFGVAFNQVEVETEDEETQAGGSNQQVLRTKKSVKVHLEEPHDELYQRIKDLNFAMAAPLLNSYAKDLQEEFNSRHQAKDISQIKSFVSKLVDLTANQNFLKNHTLLAESLIKTIKTDSAQDEALDELQGDLRDTSQSNYFNAFLELQQDILANNLDNKANYKAITEFLYMFEPPFDDVMRLLILTSIVKHGIRESEYKMFQKELVETYGIKVGPIMGRLKEMKLFCPREHQDYTFLPSLDISAPQANSASTNTGKLGSVQLINDFKNLEAYLKLMPVVENPDLANPTEPDFAFPGYVPVFTRLVESIYSRDFMQESSKATNRPGWKGFQRLGNLLDGPMEENVLVPDSKKQLFGTPPPPLRQRAKDDTLEELVIVVAIGGISHGELSTLRFVMSKFPSKRLLVLTSGVIRASDVISQAAS
ncbi:unnamed protein product [Kuraishia capsulata CBS 1993]|uniref:Sec1-like protein n=1 Tax=Kuraishia capsulata CBS 1993 TaxID=1382522 RepID=W6MLL5_9ASCO|nr:uncharacterized protein KUCA_T00001707001 [Kuraishia capsulata CBS 1993]CDK25737.1 unnamed protein product [Kuraishia capsulata CBS 1993]